MLGIAHLRRVAGSLSIARPRPLGRRHAVPWPLLGRHSVPSGPWRLLALRSALPPRRPLLRGRSLLRGTLGVRWLLRTSRLSLRLSGLLRLLLRRLPLRPGTRLHRLRGL